MVSSLHFLRLKFTSREFEPNYLAIEVYQKTSLTCIQQEQPFFSLILHDSISIYVSTTASKD
jgi:hypothetical protein